jgi:hypothetical protein
MQAQYPLASAQARMRITDEAMPKTHVRRRVHASHASG